MTAKDKTSIKAFFETGDKPTQAQFIDLIDSYVDSAGPVGQLEALASAGASGLIYTSAADIKARSAAQALSFLGATVYTTALASAAIFNGMVATTAQGNAGTATGVIMDPVLVKNAIASQAGSSSMVLLGTGTASASSSLNFTSLISSNYSAYLMIVVDLLTSTTSTLGIKMSTDNGSSWTTGMASQKAALTLGGTTAPSYTGVSNSTPVLLTTSAGGQHITGTILLVIGTSSAPTSFESYLANDNALADKVSGLSNSAGVNAVQLIPSAGTLTSGVVYFYGIKNT